MLKNPSGCAFGIAEYSFVYYIDTSWHVPTSVHILRHFPRLRLNCGNASTISLKCIKLEGNFRINNSIETIKFNEFRSL